MATANFKQREESKVFVVLENWEDEETREIISPDEYDCDELKRYVIELLKGKFKAAKYVRVEDMIKQGHSDAFCEVNGYKSFGDMDADISFNIYIDSGYYEAASLTFDITTNIDSDYSDMNEGMKKIQERNIDKWIDAMEEKLRLDIESVFTEVSTPYIRVATFSNGEAIYKPFKPNVL